MWDKATEKQQRLDFARICIEIDAESDLPDEVHIKMNGQSIVVRLEYQWLPSRCTKCKVFDHSCAPKPGVKISTSSTAWQVVEKPSGGEGSSKESAKLQEDSQMVGKDKDTNSCLGGISALEAVTVTVPNSTGAQFVIKPTDYEPSDDDSSEAMDEVLEVETNPLTSFTGVEVNNPLMKSNNSTVSKEEFKQELDPEPPNNPVECYSSHANMEGSPNKSNSREDTGKSGGMLTPQNSQKSAVNSSKKKQKRKSNSGSSTHHPKR